MSLAADQNNVTLTPEYLSENWVEELYRAR